jgi:hypothetical protein
VDPEEVVDAQRRAGDVLEERRGRDRRYERGAAGDQSASPPPTRAGGRDQRDAGGDEGAGATRVSTSMPAAQPARIARPSTIATVPQTRATASSSR